MQLLSYAHPALSSQETFYMGLEKAYFSPDGKSLILYNYNDDCVQIFNIQRRRVISKIPFKSVFTSAFSTNDELLFLGNNTGQLQEWDFATMKLKYKNPQYHKSLISKLLYLEDHHMIASTSYDGNILMRDVRQGKVVHKLEYNEDIGQIDHIAYSQQKQILAAPTGFGRQIRLWDIRRVDKILQILKANEKIVEVCEFHKSLNNILISGSGNTDSSIWKWDMFEMKGECIIKDDDMFGRIKCIESFSDSQQIIYSYQNQIRIIDIKNGSLIQNSIANPSEVYSIHMSPSEKQLAVGQSRGRVKLFDITIWNNKNNTVY